MSKGLLGLIAFLLLLVVLGGGAALSIYLSDRADRQKAAKDYIDRMREKNKKTEAEIEAMEKEARDRGRQPD